MNKPEGQREMGSEGIEVSAVSSRTGGVVLGSTLLVGGLLVVIAVVIVWLGLTGRLSDLRHASVPFRPYPPAGYAYNPFDPGNKDDLINVAEANLVKADLLADGDLELRALAIGDASLLERSTTGNFLSKLRQRLAQDTATGIYEREENHLGLFVVGRLADPQASGVVWCVEEKGTGTTAEISRATGAVLRTSRFRSTSRFWLVRVGRHYLITDAQISAVADR